MSPPLKALLLIHRASDAAHSIATGTRSTPHQSLEAPMTKCNRTVCLNEGTHAHVDIAVGHDGEPALYCTPCADRINSACRDVGIKVPRTLEEIDDAIRAVLRRRIPYESMAGALTSSMLAGRRQDDALELAARLLAPLSGGADVRDVARLTVDRLLDGEPS